MGVHYCDTRKDLPSDRLRDLFQSAGWSNGDETPEQLAHFNIGFIHSTLVVSAWDDEKLVGAVRVISDTIFRSIIHDLIVDPNYRNQGIGAELVNRCIQCYPKSEWLVQTTRPVAGYYEKIGFHVNEDVFLSIPCKLFTI